MAITQAESGNNRPHLTVSLTISSSRISLSALPNDPVISLTVHVRRTDVRPITLCTAGSVMDNGHHAHHDGIFGGAFLPLTSTLDLGRKIQLHFSGWPNYGSQPEASDNLLERDYLRFETVPGKGEGELAVIHEISLERLFRNSDLRKEAVKVGEKFTVRMNPKKLGSVQGWWTWGSLEGELNGKKLAKWELPDKEGEIGNLMPGEKMPDVERMKREGWIFSEPFHELSLEAEENEEVVVEFVE
ncbi:MAG: hypothetical protein LQ342_005626 [Letrouitia transgressa]|nr:MAG: hypothetical protein LQ342_005626 [Letrouitia transgressa]